MLFNDDEKSLLFITQYFILQKLIKTKQLELLLKKTRNYLQTKPLKKKQFLSCQEVSQFVEQAHRLANFTSAKRALPSAQTSLKVLSWNLSGRQQPPTDRYDLPALFAFVPMKTCAPPVNRASSERWTRGLLSFG